MPKVTHLYPKHLAALDMQMTAEWKSKVIEEALKE